MFKRHRLSVAISVACVRWYCKDFDKATVQVGGGKQAVIEARHSSPDAVYVQLAELNCKPLDRL